MGLVGPDSAHLMHDNFHKDVTWNRREQMATLLPSQKLVSKLFLELCRDI